MNFSVLNLKIYFVNFCNYCGGCRSKLDQVHVHLQFNYNSVAHKLRESARDDQS